MATGPAAGDLSAAPVAGPRRGRLVWILAPLSAFGPLSIDMYLPALPSMARDLDASASVAQLSLTACLAGLAAGQLLAGPLSDALGRRRPLLARFFALLLIVNGAAPIAAPIIGAQLLRFTSWRGVFAVLAVIGAALFIVAACWLPETLPAARRHRGGVRGLLRDGGRMVSDRQFTGYALASGLAFGAMFAYIAGSPFVLQAKFGISPQLFSLIFAINGLGIIGAGLLSRRLIGRRSPRELLTVGLTGSAAGGIVLLAAALLGIGLPVILPALFVMVASVGFILPNATALALGRYASQAGSASAVVGVAQFAIGAAAAPLVGIAGPHTDLPMAVVICLLGVSAWLSRPRTRPPPAAEPQNAAT